MRLKNQAKLKGPELREKIYECIAERSSTYKEILSQMGDYNIGIHGIKYALDRLRKGGHIDRYPNLKDCRQVIYYAL